MGRWDKEMIPLIPKSCKIFASAGAGFDWADVDILAERGTFLSPNLPDAKLTQISLGIVYCNRYHLTSWIGSIHF